MNRALAKYAPLIIGIVILLILVGLGTWFVMGIKSGPEQKKVVQQITVIKPPPPPPEPPPPEEEEIEEEIEEEVPEEPEPEPEALPDAPSDEPAGEELGLDADASGAGDSFGLKARKGGRGLLAGGGFGGYLKAEVNKAILKSEDLRYLDYVAVVSFILLEDGSFTAVSVDLRSGSDNAEERLLAFFRAFAGLGRKVPIEEQGKEFKMRISSVL